MGEDVFVTYHKTGLNVKKHGKPVDDRICKNDERDGRHDG